MSFVVEFYKELDAINLIIFWGVIIVVLLLLTFAIIIANKNKKLERIIEKNGIDIDAIDDDDLAIKKDVTITMPKEEPTKDNLNITVKNDEPVPIIIKEEPKPTSNIDLEIPITNVAKEIPIKEEKFIAEEHVMDYHKESMEPPILDRPNKINEPIKEVRTQETPRTAYQRNVLKEMSLSQTSPIGIASRHSENEKEINKAKELHEMLVEQNNDNVSEPIQSTTQTSSLINQRNYAASYNQSTRKGDYLEELSKKLSNDGESNDIARTEYELKQEEDAIISYQELMQKKDSIKTIDEEEAVISIDELMNKKAREEKLYNITNDEENEEFINELKHFRSDL